jgi:hypothetical protein
MLKDSVGWNTLVGLLKASGFSGHEIGIQERSQMVDSFGNEIITTTKITFAVDNYQEKSADIGVHIILWDKLGDLRVNFLPLVKFSILMTLQIGPFYFPLIFGYLGFVALAGIFCGIIFVSGRLVVVDLYIQGRDRKPVGEWA